MKHTYPSRQRSRRVSFAATAVVAAAFLAACSSNSNSSSKTTTAAAATTQPASTTGATTAETTGATTGASTDSTPATAVTTGGSTAPTAATDTTGAAVATDAATPGTVDQTLTGNAPGVSADTIKIGVTYVDTEALKAVGLNYNLGPHAKVYQALADEINAKGGINGRKLQIVLAPIDPTSPAGADAACLKLTEDDKVFLITGFFLGDSTMCPLEAHSTAVVGGGMSTALTPRAKAPWVTWTADADQSGAITQKFADAGLLKGKVAIYVAAADKPQYDTSVKPVLDKLGITPVEVGVMDAPTSDTAAIQSSVKLIAEKFKAAGADTILLVGIGTPAWPTYETDDTAYRPKLLFTDTLAARAFYTSKDTTDTSILVGSIAAGAYGPDQARFDEPAMQACIAVLKAAGLDTPAPSTLDPNDSSNQPFQAAFQACPDMILTAAVLHRAGANLNYGTLGAAIDGLKVTIPGDPTERTYGPPPAADGNPNIYLFTWNEATKSYDAEKG